jgi:hypothetical protein
MTAQGKNPSSDNIIAATQGKCVSCQHSHGAASQSLSLGIKDSKSIINRRYCIIATARIWRSNGRD